MGPHEQTILRQAMRMNQPIPDRIANAPELQLGLYLYLQAFFDLDTERSHGMTVTMIPFSAIRDYAYSFDFDIEQTESLFYHIRRMDTAHTKRIAKKSESGS